MRPEKPPQPASMPRRPFWRRHPWLTWISVAIAAALIVTSVLLAIAARRFEPYLRARIIDGLADHFHTKVELDSFHISVRHGKNAMFGLWATGKGLRIWPPNRVGGDHSLETAVQSLPLIGLEEFSFHVPLRWEQTKLLKIPQVRLRGLVIDVPPRSERDRKTGLQAAMDAQAREEDKKAHPDEAGAAPPEKGKMWSNVLVERVDCEQTELTLETDKPDKLPLSFEIAHLKLRHVTAGDPIVFEAELTNPKPKGQINSAGTFGPWQIDDPGESPVSGTYRFQHADLSDFNGIAGILSSNGSYKGTLRNLIVDGETVVPDFRLAHFAGRLPLHTRFHARVDGTNGDTFLDKVDAVLGQSRFTTSGKIVQVKLTDPTPPGATPAKPAAGKLGPTAVPELPHAGHVINVKVDVPHGRMEDFMRLVSKTGIPSITGVVQTSATLHIAPGVDPRDQPVDKRMKLDGTFTLQDARFSSDKVQQRVQELSFRAQGRPDDLKNQNPDSVTWQMQGSFHVANGVVTLPNLQYTVPGANVQLAGTYDLDGDLHMDGTARMQATVSKMVGGWKGFLLKPADRLFQRNGAGTEVPIRVRGTRQSPDFGIDLGRMGSTHPERPGQDTQ